jgi:uncharacterized protein (TIGR02147 family)
MSKQTDENLFLMDDFRTYVRNWANVRGRGEFRRIAQALNMHTTLVSQIFSGKKCFTEEQASVLCSYMGLNSLETDYFLKLVQHERAGTENLKSVFRRHLKQIRDQANEIRNRVPESKELSKEDRALYYSSWQYSVIRLLTSIEEFQTIEEIASYLKLSVSRVTEVLDFLTSRGLCQRSGNKFTRTPQNTHVEAQSPLSIRHHQNWRTKSLEFLEKTTPQDLAFTAPISLSKKDKDRVRSILLGAISDISKIVESSPAEEVLYLGIDWIKI